MLILVFLSIDLRWIDSEVLKAGYWLFGESCSRPIGLTYAFIIHAANKISNSKISFPGLIVIWPRCITAIHVPKQDFFKQDILKILNLEDTSSKHPAPSRLRDSRGVLFVKAITANPVNLRHNRQRDNLDGLLREEMQ
jgi:hypothetical protein